MGILTSYEGSNDDFENMGTGAYVGQSFQIPDNSPVVAVSIYGARGNASSGTFKVEILSGNIATGTVLTTTGTLTSSSALTTYAGGAQWNQFAVTTVNLSSGTTYFLKLTALSGSANDEVRWSVDTTSPSYAGGSSYNGATANTSRDRNFRVSGPIASTIYLKGRPRSRFDFTGVSAG
jgi:hypothetical protein